MQTSGTNGYYSPTSAHLENDPQVQNGPPQPDPKPDYYGTTQHVDADYYPDSHKLKSEKMYDEHENSVQYDFGPDGKRTHELDTQMIGPRAGPEQEFRYDQNGTRIPVPRRQFY